MRLEGLNNRADGTARTPGPPAGDVAAAELLQSCRLPTEETVLPLESQIR